MDGRLPSVASIKTYSRKKRKCDINEEDAPKRRRIDHEAIHSDELQLPTAFTADTENTLLPSESSDATSSYDVLSSERDLPTTTPPSSPPLLAATKDVNRADDKAAGVTSTSGCKAMRPRDNNARIETRRSSIKRPKSDRFVQMQINLGTSTQRTCNTCGMTYVSTNEEDTALHKRYHQQCVEGVDLGKVFKKAVAARTVWHDSEGHSIAVVTAHDSTLAKTKARAALEIAQNELGAVDIPDKELWSLTSETLAAAGFDGEAKSTPSKAASSSRYKMYLYLDGARCQGLCLAETISEAHAIVPKTWKEGVAVAAQDDSLMVYNHEFDLQAISSPARIGISRIWTSSRYRRKGVASALLNSISKTFYDHSPVARSLIAFSQPTDLGKKLAKDWTKMDHGWKVYFERPK